jgi:4-amino-4-deoxychorismate lyase
LFWQRQGRLETPCLDDCGVAGTLRAALLTRLPIAQVAAGPQVLNEAEAVWLGNSIQGIWPVVRLDAADGAVQRSWELGRAHRVLQSEAHELLGYPIAFGN